MESSEPYQGPIGDASLFEVKIKSAIEGGWMTMGLALGHATGLFDVMCGLNTWATSAEIAAKGKCKERYVREWLYHMTSCDVIKMEERSFIIPQENRKILTGDEIRQSVYILGLSCPFPKLVNCFKQDGPLGLDIKTASHWLSFWEDDRDMGNMRTEMMSQVSEELVKQLERGARCCDLGAGKGNLMLAFASEYPKSKFISFDCSQSAIDDGLAEAERRCIKNVAFVQGDIHNVPDQWTDEFDYIIMVEVLHNLPYPDKAMEEMYRILKPGGFLSLLETKADSDPAMTVRNKGTFYPPHNMYAVNLYYCMTTSLAFPSGAGLGICPGHQKLTEIVRRGGFESIQIDEVAHSLHMFCSKPRRG